MSDPRSQLVAAGYDAMIDTWEAWKEQITGDPRDTWCAELLDRLPAGSRVVELELLAEAGVTLLRDEVVTIREPERHVSFHWVLGRS